MTGIQIYVWNYDNKRRSEERNCIEDAGVRLYCGLNNTTGCGHTVGCCEVDNELSGAVDVGEFCDSGFAAPEGFCSNQLDTINKLNLHSEIWGSHGSEYEYYIILGYEVIALINTDVSEEAATRVFGFELRSLNILRRGELVYIFWLSPWYGSQGFWLLIMRSRVRFPVLTRGFFLLGKFPMVTMVWVVSRFRFKGSSWYIISTHFTSHFIGTT